MIGGGASAVCLLDAIAQNPDMPAGSLTVFEPSRHMWRGRAYQPDIDTVRVNAPPWDMSVRAHDATHFAHWLDARDAVFGPDDHHLDPRTGMRFVPRAVYGDYLEQSARSALLLLGARGWRTTVVREHVTAATTLDGGVLLRTEHGRDVQVDRAVLCFGAGRPADPYDLAGRPGFVADPYPVARNLGGLAPDAAVAVVGGGLTAIDAVLALTELGHRGPLMLVSRSGILPAVRQRPVRHHLRHFTPQRFKDVTAAGASLGLAEVVALMAAELADVGEDVGTVRAEIEAMVHEEPVARLRRQLTEVDSPSVALRIVQKAVPECGPDVWTALRPAERTRFLDGYYRAAMSLCCPMPPATAEKLLTLFDAGQLTVVRDTRAVEALDGGGFSIVGEAGAHRADVVVNGVNARLRKFAGAAAPLVSSLVAEGLAEVHPHGGLALERAASRLTVGGRPDPRLYALGDPGTGSLFFTFGVESLVDRAVDIAHDLASAEVGAGPAGLSGHRGSPSPLFS